MSCSNFTVLYFPDQTQILEHSHSLSCLLHTIFSFLRCQLTRTHCLLNAIALPDPHFLSVPLVPNATITKQLRTTEKRMNKNTLEKTTSTVVQGQITNPEEQCIFYRKKNLTAYLPTRGEKVVKGGKKPFWFLFLKVISLSYSNSKYYKDIPITLYQFMIRQFMQRFFICNYEPLHFFYIKILAL